MKNRKNFCVVWNWIRWIQSTSLKLPATHKEPCSYNWKLIKSVKMFSLHSMQNVCAGLTLSNRYVNLGVQQSAAERGWHSCDSLAYGKIPADRRPLLETTWSDAFYSLNDRPALLETTRSDAFYSLDDRPALLETTRSDAFYSLDNRPPLLEITWSDAFYSL